MFLLGVEGSTDAIRHNGVSRRDENPWTAVGDVFRPSLRALDKAFREDHELKETRTFATFCHEVNYLLTAFHEKRAYLPDNGFTTLSDAELEQRLFNVSKISHIPPRKFAGMIQDSYTMNFWLGCAKYWCASDYKFAPEGDYDPDHIRVVRRMHPQAAFNLVLPKPEIARLGAAYQAVWAAPPDIENYPDAVIQTSVLNEQGVTIDRTLYRMIYSNNVFTVYTKIPRK